MLVAKLQRAHAAYKESCLTPRLTGALGRPQARDEMDARPVEPVVRPRVVSKIHVFITASDPLVCSTLGLSLNLRSLSSFSPKSL